MHVPGPVKKFLGIASPSKLFTQFGSWTMEGLSNGINNGASGVMTSVTNVAKNMAKSPIKGPSVVYDNIIPQMGAAQSASGSLTYTIESNLERLRAVLTMFVESLKNLPKPPPPGENPGGGFTPIGVRGRSQSASTEPVRVELNIQPGAITVHAADQADIDQQIQAALVAFAREKLPGLVKEAIRTNGGKKATYIPGLN